MSNIRTRNYGDLTNWEIEQYLERNDIIVIPVGNCEAHAGMPVDVEYMMAEGYARLIAEKVDGLLLQNVLYFNVGGTQIGRGTIHMSMSESFRYTKELAHSLLNQGFKRQIWIPSHVPTSMFLEGMLVEFFDETKVPMLYLNTGDYFRNLGLTPDPWKSLGQKTYTKSGKEVHPMDDTIYASYRMAGRLNAIPAIGEVEFPPAPPKDPNYFFPMPDWFKETIAVLGRCGRMGSTPAYYYCHPNEHIGGPELKYTREEMEERAVVGEEYMRELVDAGEFDVLMDALKKLQGHMRRLAEEHYDQLPKNRYSPIPFK